MPACIKCNRDKGTSHTRTARSWYGNTSAPPSKDRKQKLEEEEDNDVLELLGIGVATFIGYRIAKSITSSNFIPRKQLLKIRRTHNHMRQVARNKYGKPVFIRDAEVENGLKCECFCIDCNQPLI